MELLEQAVFVNGTVGAGKTTVAYTLGKLLKESSIAHAVIDLDGIRQAWPAPPGDRFNHELELANLTSLARNYSDAGIGVLILAGVIEHRTEVPRYQQAVGNRPLTVIRITADESTLRSRLTARHTNDGEGLEWHLNRAAELEAILIEQGPAGLVVDSSNRTPSLVAQEILAELSGVPTAN
jgi:adenylylsulfate kinase